MIVVDTNVIAYYILPTKDTADAIRLRQRDAEWIAPGLWRSEFRNMLLRYVRSGEIDTEKAKYAVAAAKKIVLVRSVNSDRILDLAASSGCTASDCEFVSLAERLRVPLVTNDRQVLSAFPDLAVSILDFVNQ